MESQGRKWLRVDFDWLAPFWTGVIYFLAIPVIIFSWGVVAVVDKVRSTWRKTRQ